MTKTPAMLAAYPKQGSGGFSALPLPDYIDSLSYTTHEEFTVPAKAHFMSLSVSVLSYIQRTDNAATPTDITNGTGSFVLNPGVQPYIFACEAGEVYSVVSAGAVISIGYYGR